MKKIVTFSLTVALVLGAGFGIQEAGAKNKYFYKQANNPANYVRLDKLRTRKAEEMSLNQPYTITEDKMADILRSLRYNRKAIFSDQIKVRNVYEEEYIEKFTPYLVKAFQAVTPFQTVYFSVAQSRPWYIIRNDRLTQLRMWIVGDEMHLQFGKTEAKLLGDYKARTQAGRKQIRNAKGLRISLEPQEGQKFAFDSNKEIIADLNLNWEDIVIKIEEEEDRIKQAEAFKKARGSKKRKYAAEPTPKQPTSVKDQKNAMDRLTELKKLKDKGLISEDDYNKKKDEILQDM